MVTITIKSGKHEYILDIDEATKLYNELDKLFGDKVSTTSPWTIPYTPYNPYNPMEPYAWYKQTYSDGTCDCKNTGTFNVPTSATTEYILNKGNK